MKTGKKLLALGVLISILVINCVASADVVGIVTGDFSDGKICRTIAPNNQELFYVSSADQEYAKLEDVNSDGAEDVVVLTISGASNTAYRFFIWNGAEFTPVVTIGKAQHLYNYQLHPELGLISTSLNNGLAGALHEQYIYRWVGNELHLIRYAQAVEDSTWSFEDGIATTRVDTNAIAIRVCDVGFSDADGYSETMIWEQKASLTDENLDKILEQEQAILWNGLR